MGTTSGPPPGHSGWTSWFCSSRTCAGAPRPWCTGSSRSHLSCEISLLLLYADLAILLLASWTLIWSQELSSHRLPSSLSYFKPEYRNYLSLSFSATSWILLASNHPLTIIIYFCCRTTLPSSYDKVAFEP